MFPTLTELPDLGLLLARGPQAVDLLHAQLTQNLRDWPAETARPAALCTPQGRVLSDFLLWREDEQGIALLLRNELLAPMLQRLRMYILRLRCTVEDGSAQHRVHGLLEDAQAASAAPVALQVWQVRQAHDCCWIRLPDAPGLRRILVVCHGAGDVGALLPGVARGEPQGWELAAIRAGVAPIGSATSGKLVPQMLNYEAIGAVDFHKGCYPGQEVIARTQFRGTIKRRLFRIVGELPMAAGDEVFGSSDPAQPCGMVVHAAQAAPEQWEALAELKLDALQQGTLHLRAADGAQLLPATLPYALPPQD